MYRVSAQESAPLLDLYIKTPPIETNKNNQDESRSTIANYKAYHYYFS